MHLRITLFLITLGLLTSISAQDPFERLYRSPADGHIATAIDARGTGFVVLSMQVNDQGENKAVNVTTFNQKGNVDWSAEYTFMDTLDILAPGDILSMENGNIVFSVLLDKDSLNKVVTLVDPGSGGVIWTRITGQNELIGRAANAPSRLIETLDSEIIHTHRLLNTDGVDPILLTALGIDGTITFEQWLSVLGGGEAHIEDLLFDIDSTVLILGSTGIDTTPIFLSKMDTGGNILWTRTYDVLVSESEDPQGLHLAQLTDTTLAIVGGISAGNSTPRSLFVIQTDANGNAMRTERLNSNIPGEVFPVGLAALNTDIVMAVKNLRSSDVITTLVKYNLDSVILYESLMDTTTNELIYQGGLISGDSVTAAYVSSSYYPEFDNLAPYIAKVGMGGETPCYTPTMQFSIDSVGVRQDTLSWNVETSMIEDSIQIEGRSYSFDPPRFTLQDTTYCPNDVINFLLDATTRGATAYLWSDGSTDSTLLVTEEGMYMVTVTVGIEECFSLCDTSDIMRTMLPMVAIGAENQFCERGEFVLTSNEMIQTVLVSRDWSTGETSPQITVSEPGTYTVMIVDACGDMASAPITLTQTDFSGTTNLNTNTSGLICDDRSIILSVTAVPDQSLLSWSTGESGVLSIGITEPGTYTVTYNDVFCPGTATFNITEDNFNVIPDLRTGEMCDPINMEYDLFTLGGRIESGINTYEWTIGSTDVFDRDSTISVTSAGDYTITVLGVCGDPVSETIEVSQEAISRCIPVDTCLVFPNVFIPRDQDEMNRSFGPRLDCQPDEYELRIYNRWGQNIWTTTDVDERWDGTKDGDQVPGGVYFWWSREVIDSQPLFQEGDVTLLR